MKKIISLALVLVMLAAAMAGCNTTQADYTVGICQLMVHDSLDQATQGFIDALNEKMAAAGKTVAFDTQVAGEADLCTTVVNTFTAKNVDLIMANATPALQAAVAGTASIPILGTSVTEYGVALEIKDFNGIPGGNVSGTSSSHSVNSAMVFSL